MRTFMKIGLVALLALAACEKTQPARDPVSGNDPKPQDPMLPSAGPQKSTIESHGAQSSTFSTSPQNSVLPSAPPQKPFSQPEAQKPLYGPGLTAPDDRASAKTEKPLSDGEIMMVTRTADEGEVQLAEMAKKKATNKEVKQYASMMFTQHTASLQKGRTLQTKTKIVPSASDLSTKLEGDASTVATNLRGKEGKEFDRLYVDSQVRMHKDLLDAIDNRLLTSASNAELKTMLTETRRVVADHLAKAEDIQKKVDPTTASARQGSGDGNGNGKAKTSDDHGAMHEGSKAKSDPGAAKSVEDPAKQKKDVEPKY